MAKTKKIAKKILSIFTSCALILAIGLVGIGLVEKFTNVNIFPYRLVWVMTGSMEPDIPAQSYILVKTIDADDVKEGMIISFYSSDSQIEGELNTHQVIEINPDGTFKTKGKANKTADSASCKREDVYGRYICNLKLLTLFGKFFQTKAGLVTVLLIITISFTIMSGIFKVKTPDETKQDEMNRLIKLEVERLEKENKNNN